MKKLKSVFFDFVNNGRGLEKMHEADYLSEIKNISKDCERFGIKISEEEKANAISNAPPLRFAKNGDYVWINVLSLEIVSPQSIYHYSQTLDLYWRGIFPYRFYMKKENELEKSGFKSKFDVNNFKGLEVKLKWVKFSPEDTQRYLADWFAFLHFISIFESRREYWNKVLKENEFVALFLDDVKYATVYKMDHCNISLQYGIILDSTYDEFDQGHNDG